MISVHFFLKSVSLCVLWPVLVTHIPRVMIHYPSTQNTVSPCYFTAMIKSSSHACCFITLIPLTRTNHCFYDKSQTYIQFIAFMINPSARLGLVLPFILNPQHIDISIQAFMTNLECMSLAFMTNCLSWAQMNFSP